MFKRILFLVIFGISITSTNAADIRINNDKGDKSMVSVSDYQAVKNTLNKYLEAGKKGKSEIMKSAFYKDAIMYNADNGNINGGAIKALFDYIDANPAAPEIEAEITSIDIAGNIAYAKVESNNWHGARFSDMFLLLKDNGTWKILTKAFYTN